MNKHHKTQLKDMDQLENYIILTLIMYLTKNTQSKLLRSIFTNEKIRIN